MDEPLIIVPGQAKAPAKPPKAKHCGWRIDGCWMGNCTCPCSDCDAAAVAAGLRKAKEDGRAGATDHFTMKAILARASARHLRKKNPPQGIDTPARS